jgi:hypothetical protein
VPTFEVDFDVRMVNFSEGAAQRAPSLDYTDYRAVERRFDLDPREGVPVYSVRPFASACS